MSSSNQHRPKVLVILSRFPYPLEKGDKLRAYQQIKELSNYCDVELFAVTDVRIETKHIDEVKMYCSGVHIHYLRPLNRYINLLTTLFSNLPLQTGYFFSTKAKRRIKALTESVEFNHIYCQLIRTTEYVKNIHHIPKTLDYMDALSAGIQRRIDREPLFRRWLFHLEARRLTNYERSIFDFFENRTIISSQDRDLIKHPDNNKISCIPNGIDPSFFETIERPETHDFVFVGNMSYPPNVDAVKYIAWQILPALEGTTLLVSGATPHPSIVRLAEKNDRITLTGWVDDIRKSYTDGKLFLAPMTIGTGMQNKLLEAMALKSPCITTDLANNAIEAIPGLQIIVGNTKEELIEACKLLLADDNMRKQIADNARSFVQEKYNWRESTLKLAKLMFGEDFQNSSRNQG